MEVRTDRLESTEWSDLLRLLPAQLRYRTSWEMRIRSGPEIGAYFWARMGFLPASTGLRNDAEGSLNRIPEKLARVISSAESGGLKTSAVQVDALRALCDEASECRNSGAGGIVRRIAGLEILMPEVASDRSYTRGTREAGGGTLGRHLLEGAGCDALWYLSLSNCWTDGYLTLSREAEGLLRRLGDWLQDGNHGSDCLEHVLAQN